MASVNSEARTTLESSLSGSGFFTDNLFFTDANKQDDLGLFVSPAITLGYESTDAVLDVGYQGTAQFFINNPSQNTYAQSANIGVDLPFLTRRYQRLEVKIIESFNFSPQLQAFSFTGELSSKDSKRKHRLQKINQVLR